MKNRDKILGFSMIELAIALVVISMMGAAALETYNTYARTKLQNVTAERRMNVEAALLRFYSLEKRFPCPADPALNQNSPQAGRETTGCAPTGAMVRVAGQRDSPATVDTVLIGMVPYIALGISPRDAQDSWGGRLTYAITESLTVAGADRKNGTIRIRNTTAAGLEFTELNTSVPDPFMGGTPDAFMLALVSHGPDRKGAYNSSGVRPVPCSGNGRDLENCDGDSVFLDSSLRRIYREGDANFYDDAYLTYDMSLDIDKWITAVGTSAIESNQGGNIGIGVMMPTERVDVDGNIRAEEVQADRFCNNAGANCFPAELIGGTGASCGGGVATGISNATMNCANKVSTAGIAAGTCPAGQYMIGFENGAIKCQ